MINFFSRLTRRSKVKLAITLSFLLIVATFFGVAVKTGRLGGLAAGSTKTVIIQGTYTNNLTGRPVTGAKVIANFYNGSMTATTDRKGFYKITLYLDTSDPKQTIVKLWQNMTGYPSGYSTRATLLIPNVATSRITLTHNFSFSQIPQDAVSQTNLDPVSQRCRTNQGSYEYKQDLYHTGDYKGEVINGVLICASTGNSGFLDEYRTDIEKNTVQIGSLVARTGLPYTPTIYLTGPITWMKNAAAYTSSGGREIVINVSSLLDLSLITHEFGHLVDWHKGPDRPANDELCDKNISGTKSHCYLSWRRNDFIYAASIVWQQKYISGYANTNPGEMFAEMFMELNTPDSPGSDLFTARAHAQYNITNALLGGYPDDFAGESTQFNLPTTVAAQNAAMYIYKFVTAANNLEEFFPGTLSDSYDYNQIWYGQYMSVGVVSIRIKDCGTLKGGVSATIDGQTAQTRLKKTSGAFPDGEGDLFDTTGTAVFFNVITGDQPITVAGYALGSTNPTSFRIIPGANPILGIEVKSSGTYKFSKGFSWWGDADDLAIDPLSGNIFVLGMKDGGLGIYVYDSNGSLIRQFGQNSGLFHVSLDIAIDSTGKIYVLDTTFGGFDPKINVFKNDGTFIKTIVAPPSIDPIPNDGIGPGFGKIAIDSSDHLVYQFTENVSIYSTNGDLIRSLTLSGGSSIWGLAIDKDGKIYNLIRKIEVDKYKTSVIIYDANGNYFNSLVAGEAEPRGLAVDSYGKIFIGLGSGVDIYDSQLFYLNRFDTYGGMIPGGGLDVGKDGKVAIGEDPDQTAVLTASVEIFLPACL